MSVTIVKIRITIFWCIWWQNTIIEVRSKEHFNFGQYFPCWHCRWRSQSSRWPLGWPHQHHLQWRQHQQQLLQGIPVRFIIVSLQFNQNLYFWHIKEILPIKSGLNFNPPRCRPQADAAKPDETSCSHWQWRNSLIRASYSFDLLFIDQRPISLFLIDLWPFILRPTSL